MSKPRQTQSPRGTYVAPCPCCGARLLAEQHLVSWDDHYVELTEVVADPTGDGTPAACERKHAVLPMGE